MQKFSFFGCLTLLALAALLFSGTTALAKSPAQSSQNAPQKASVSGIVLDANGTPVIGAGVMAVGTKTGTVTDLNGNFGLDISVGTSLEISCIGYATQTVSASKSMRIILREDSTFLDEVVVVGYGSQRKSEITGSMARMGSPAKFRVGV